MARKALLIGGTGSLGHALAPILLKHGYRVSVLSREEIKQKKMQALFPEITFHLGDVRDYDSLSEHCLGKEVVFHLAAMKHVDLAETNLSECLKINLVGTQNVIKACLENNVSYAAFSSTDKAVLPINAYGMCKALSEKLWFAANNHNFCLFSVFRWGNVLGSRGSVIHSFVHSLKEEKRVCITDLDMTRFWIHIDDVAKFMIDNFEFGNSNQPYLPEMKAASLLRLADVTAQYLGISDYKVDKVPIRPGEKIHEWLDYHDPDTELKSNTATQYSDEELFSLIERTLR